MVINSSNLDKFRIDFNEAVKDLENKYNVVIKMGTISYDQDQFSFRVQANNGTSEEDVRRRDYLKRCSEYYLTPQDLNNLTFNYNGRDYVVSGLSSRKTKFAILAKDRLTGKEYGFTLDAIPELVRRRERRFNN